MAISSKLVEPSEGIPQGNLVRNQNNFRLFQSFLRNIPFFLGGGDGGFHLVRWKIPSILWLNEKRKQQQHLTQIFLSEQRQINCDPSHDPRIKRSRDAVTDFDFVSSGVDRCFSIHLSFPQFRCQFWSIQSIMSIYLEIHLLASFLNIWNIHKSIEFYFSFLK